MVASDGAALLHVGFGIVYIHARRLERGSEIDRSLPVISVPFVSRSIAYGLLRRLAEKAGFCKLQTKQEFYGHQ